MQLHYVKNEINLKYMLRLSYRYIFAGLLMFAGCMLVRLVLTGFICMVVQIIVGVVIYFGILIYFKDFRIKAIKRWLRGFKDKFIYMMINKVRAKILGNLARN